MSAERVGPRAEEQPSTLVEQEGGKGQADEELEGGNQKQPALVDCSLAVALADSQLSSSGKAFYHSGAGGE